jgi:hypothetical protein
MIGVAELVDNYFPPCRWEQLGSDELQGDLASLCWLYLLGKGRLESKKIQEYSWCFEGTGDWRAQEDGQKGGERAEY